MTTQSGKVDVSFRKLSKFLYVGMEDVIQLPADFPLLGSSSYVPSSENPFSGIGEILGEAAEGKDGKYQVVDKISDIGSSIVTGKKEGYYLLTLEGEWKEDKYAFSAVREFNEVYGRLDRWIEANPKIRDTTNMHSRASRRHSYFHLNGRSFDGYDSNEQHLWRVLEIAPESDDVPGVGVLFAAIKHYNFNVLPSIWPRKTERTLEERLIEEGFSISRKSDYHIHVDLKDDRAVPRIDFPNIAAFDESDIVGKKPLEAYDLDGVKGFAEGMRQIIKESKYHGRIYAVALLKEGGILLRSGMKPIDSAQPPGLLYYCDASQSLIRDNFGSFNRAT